MQKFKAIFIGNNVSINEYICTDTTCRNTLTDAVIELDSMLEDTPEEAILSLVARLRCQVIFLQTEIDTQTDKPIIGRAKTLLRKYKAFLEILENYVYG
jgi:hypothetical protein